MRVAVILVNYNTRDLLRNALTSIATSARLSSIAEDDVTIVVVDNASHDGSARLVAAEFPQVRLLALDENTGFTRGNNLALTALGFPIGEGHAHEPSAELPDYVLLLNPDAELIGDALGQMMRFLDEQPGAGCCGPRLTYGDGSFQHGAFAFPSLCQLALDLFPVHKRPLGGRLYEGTVNGRYPRRHWDAGAPFAVDFVLGAALMMRADALLRIGGLDEGYFMYCEEMDWCLRLQEASMTAFAVPAAHVTHHEAQSSRQFPWPSFRNLWRSRMRFYAKHRRHYARGNLLAVRTLTRMAMRLRARATRRRFAQGLVSGTEAADALAAYAFVGRL